VIYDEHDTKTYVDPEGRIARIVLDDVVVLKLSRPADGRWELASVKIAGSSEPLFNPAWRTQNVVDRLADLEPDGEARIFDDAARYAREALTALGVIQIGGGNAAG
jgi:hypothetical protein